MLLLVNKALHKFVLIHFPFYTLLLSQKWGEAFAQIVK